MLRSFTGRLLLLLAMLALTGAMACKSTPDPESDAGPAAPGSGDGGSGSIATQEPQLFGNLGDHHRDVSTDNEKAQAYFDEALIWAYSFNYDESERSFREAARLDPDCAMAWWGIALVNGPHINVPMVDAEHAAKAWNAIIRAQQAPNASEVERELIAAMATRYSAAYTEDRSALDQAYANAMGKVWERHRDDADVCALYAEALMDLQPWDLWTVDGQPKGNAEKIVAVLEHGLAIAPDHPALCHYYVHAVEASADPARAMAVADRLGGLVPGSSHMVHMPAHIYTRTGRYHDAAEANRGAVRSDVAYLKKSPYHGVWHAYRAHNYHFLAYDCMMLGRRAEALEAARNMATRLPSQFIRELAVFADGYMPIELMAMIRFGMWDEILAEPDFPDYLPISRSMRHYARGVAYSATGRVDEAAKELDAFLAARASVTDAMIVGNNPALDVLGVAEWMLRGELAWRRGEKQTAFETLAEAIRREEALKYDEPPGWLHPVRHALGAFLVADGQYAEAEAVYRADLARLPENGWSLYGLAECLKKQGKAEEAAQVRARFDKAWKYADFPLDSSCACEQWTR